MIQKLVLALFLVALPLLSFSQKMTIKGYVQDTTNNQSLPLKNATATLVRIKDSVLIGFKRTDVNGNFSFTNIAIDTFELVISHPKFNDYTYYIFGSSTNNEFDIKRITLPPKSQLLKEVAIYAYKDPIYYKGDTLVYVADSFKTKPNAVVEDLLKKLPGIKVAADGSIQAQGKDIQQVLVDGDEFFGADPTMATRNLGAKGVETVEIYEKKDENATDDSETIQVLDLKLKDEAKRGYFGKIAGATDAGLSKNLKNSTSTNNGFYEGEFLANKFNKTQKFSVFSLASNTMKSSLAWKDMYKYGLASRNFFDEETDNWNWNTTQSQGDGIPTTLKTGIYYNDQITKKTELNVNYTYSNGGLVTQKTNHSQYFLTDTSYTTDLTSKTDNSNESHTLNFKLTSKLDSLTTIEFESNAALNKSTTYAKDSTDFVREDAIISRNTSVVNDNNATGGSLTSRVMFKREFKKKGRKLTSFYRLVLDDNNSDGKLTITNSSGGISYLTGQTKESTSSSNSHTASITYIEPFGKKLKLEMEYEFYRNYNVQNKFTYYIDPITGKNDSLISMYSNDFQTTKNQNRIGSQLIFEHKKHKLSGGIRYRNIYIENKNILLDSNINQNFNNFLPRARYVYKISQYNRLSVSYNTNSSQPTISQLQPVRDNSNPNRLVEGNASLKPNFVHTISAGYNFYKALSGTHFWSSLNHTITNNAFTSETTFNPDGSTTTKTVNVNGNRNSSLSFGGGFPVFNKFLEIFPNVNMGYSLTKSFIDNAENTTINKSIGGGTEFRIERDSIEFSVGGRYTYNSPTSSISTQSNLPYVSQNYTSSVKWTLPKGFFIESDANYTINSKRAQGYNINYFIWNASVSKSFLKNENLIATIHCYDILNQNTSANRFINANVITDTRSVIIARYLMVRLTFKFNSNKTKESNDMF